MGIVVGNADMFYDSPLLPNKKSPNCREENGNTRLMFGFWLHEAPHMSNIISETKSERGNVQLLVVFGFFVSFHV